MNSLYLIDIFEYFIIKNKTEQFKAILQIFYYTVLP